MIKLLVFGAGVAISGVQMAAIRLITPYFGGSQIVWACAIGLLMLYLAIGYWLGGRLAVLNLRPSLPYTITGLSGLLCGIVPLVSSFLLEFTLNFGQIGGTLISLVTLFALPSVLLASINPLAIQISLKTADQTGRTVGNIYWLTTVGNLSGLFGTVLFLLPSIGVRATFITFALLLFGLALPGLLKIKQRVK
jgi:hypothetical protein